MVVRIPLKVMDRFDLRTELVRALHQAVAAGMSAEGAAQVESAAQLATFAHRGQTRKYRDGNERTPYIEHPLRVALRILRWGSTDAELVCAALLHDVVEDSAQLVAETLCRDNLARRVAIGVSAHPEIDTALDVVAAYGDRVRALVLEVTNLPNSTESYLDKVVRISADRDAALIKLSDMVDNAGSLPHQAGHVSDEFISKRADKYRPALEVLISALKPASLGPVCNEAASHGQRIADALDRL